jgi:hypothetical protein
MPNAWNDQYLSQTSDKCKPIQPIDLYNLFKRLNGDIVKSRNLEGRHFQICGRTGRD